MDKEKLTIPQEMIDKEIRYRIANLFIEKQVIIDNLFTFVDYIKENPILIKGQKIDLDDYGQIRRIVTDLENKGYIERFGPLMVEMELTKKGKEYAQSFKGESSSFLFDY